MIRVASFNVKNLSYAAIDNDSKKKRSLKGIADLVRDYDIVVMQEVLDPKVVELLTQKINAAPAFSTFFRHWRGVWVDLQPSSINYPYLGDNRHEGYAYFWNTRKVELLKDDKGIDIIPKKYSHYKVGYGANRLLRDPGYGRFILKNRIRPVEIRVITTHIVFSNPKTKGDIDIPDLSDTKNRKREFEILAGRIYKSINEHRKEPNVNAVYTIIIGDYNLSLEGKDIPSATVPAVCCFYSNGNRYFNIFDDDTMGINVIKTVQDEPTTIKKDCTDYANNYDHCSYDRKMEQAIIKCYRKPVLNDKSPEEIEEYRDTISDHVPIVVELRC